MATPRLTLQDLRNSALDEPELVRANTLLEQQRIIQCTPEHDSMRANT